MEIGVLLQELNEIEWNQYKNESMNANYNKKNRSEFDFHSYSIEIISAHLS